MSKGAQFCVFFVLDLEAFLVEILRFLLIYQVLVDQSLAMDAHEVLILSRKSCANPSSELGDRVWIWRS
jgi:hypothetical protein